MKRNLVVGAGISGATIANLIATKANEKVVVIDKNNHIAGNCYDYVDENGINIHKYGSHIFHTNSDVVWNYLNNFAKFNDYTHKVLASFDGMKIPIPFNFNSIYKVFNCSLAEKLESKLLQQFKKDDKISILALKNSEDKDFQLLAKYIYEKIYLKYTIKQWGIAPNKIDETVINRVPVILNNDNRYFQDKYQGIPIYGYTDMVKNMLNNPNIEVILQKDYKDFAEKNFDRTFFTGSIDEYFNYELGVLPYRSVRFALETFDKQYYQENSVINFTQYEPYTRIHEYKYYLRNSSNKTVIAKEYSEEFQLNKNKRDYPIINDENISLYNKYYQKAENSDNSYFLGRLGEYKYYNMDNAILNAIQIFDKIFNIQDR